MPRTYLLKDIFKSPDPRITASHITRDIEDSVGGRDDRSGIEVRTTALWMMDDLALGYPRGHYDSGDSNTEAIEIKSVGRLASVGVRDSSLRWGDVVVEATMLVVSNHKSE